MRKQYAGARHKSEAETEYEEWEEVVIKGSVRYRHKVTGEVRITDPRPKVQQKGAAPVSKEEEVEESFRKIVMKDLQKAVKKRNIARIEFAIEEAIEAGIDKAMIKDAEKVLRELENEQALKALAAGGLANPEVQSRGKTEQGRRDSLRMMFDAVDTSRDGNITIREMKEWVQSNPEQAGKFFGKDEIGSSEIMKFFDAADVDGDRNIGFEEFAKEYGQRMKKAQEASAKPEEASASTGKTKPEQNSSDSSDSETGKARKDKGHHKAGDETKEEEGNVLDQLFGWFGQIGNDSEKQEEEKAKLLEFKYNVSKQLKKGIKKKQKERIELGLQEAKLAGVEKELIAAAKKVLQELRCREIFEAVDDDGNGTVSPQELKQWCRKNPEMTKAIFGKDKVGASALANFFDQADENGDQALEFEEFYAEWCRRIEDTAAKEKVALQPCTSPRARAGPSVVPCSSEDSPTNRNSPKDLSPIASPRSSPSGGGRSKAPGSASRGYQRQKKPAENSEEKQPRSRALVPLPLEATKPLESTAEELPGVSSEPIVVGGLRKAELFCNTANDDCSAADASEARSSQGWVKKTVTAPATSFASNSPRGGDVPLSSVAPASPRGGGYVKRERRLNNASSADSNLGEDVSRIKEEANPQSSAERAAKFTSNTPSESHSEVPAIVNGASRYRRKQKPPDSSAYASS
eukprot:gnl/MRDRNA2_/MRDRNA2_62949_c0_seq1.p1 gnl/MRDRNA2_/MRDRNA2_62949_c0~~gnl/MRDRNA2_/MRDRNA2_62949_c0_seq1.p1  ORF type:complete len:690 (+),score=164.13 gnl/MRDRNA2_/MRDRNA2_62949_c0_seq1:121-2190(+)